MKTNAPKMVTTEYFELVSTEDLRVEESYNGMIMYSEKTGSFASQKACGCRSIFPTTTLFHPTDGNCIVAEIDRTERLCLIAANNRKNFSLATDDFKRVTSVTALKRCIKHYNEFTKLKSSISICLEATKKLARALEEDKVTCHMCDGSGESPHGGGPCCICDGEGVLDA